MAAVRKRSIVGESESNAIENYRSGKNRDRSIDKMDLSAFGKTARSLARNPLGIIALFIVLIYGIAGLVFGFSSSRLDSMQKWPLIIFLVTFPLIVFLGFLWLVAKHSLKLYAPSDFRKDDSFVELNRKVSLIAVRQTAAEVDPRGDSEAGNNTLEALLSAGQIDTAKSLAKAFLKVRRYDVSLRMFDRIIDRANSELGKTLFQYRAYSLIGLGRNDEAAHVLEMVKTFGSERLYDFWPRLALAYCYLKLKRNLDFENALHDALLYPTASEYQEMVGTYYPEIAKPYFEGLRLLNPTPVPSDGSGKAQT